MEMLVLSVEEVEALRDIACDPNTPPRTQLVACNAVLEAVGPEMAREAIRKAAAKSLGEVEG